MTPFSPKLEEVPHRTCLFLLEAFAVTATLEQTTRKWLMGCFLLTDLWLSSSALSLGIGLPAEWWVSEGGSVFGRWSPRLGGT